MFNCLLYYSTILSFFFFVLVHLKKKANHCLRAALPVTPKEEASEFLWVLKFDLAYLIFASYMGLYTRITRGRRLKQTERKASSSPPLNYALLPQECLLGTVTVSELFFIMYL